MAQTLSTLFGKPQRIGQEDAKALSREFYPKAKFYLPALILLGAEHGASRQEALSLKWADVNFSFKEIGVIRFFRSKTGRERWNT